MHAKTPQVFLDNATASERAVAFLAGRFCPYFAGRDVQLRFMRELKKSSSAWVHDEIGFAKFAWQEGCGALTVSPPSRHGVKGYIANQEEHHRKLTFREELVSLLEQVGVEYDSKWLD